MITTLTKAAFGGMVALCATLQPVAAQSAGFRDTQAPPAHLGTRSDASVGLYLTVPFGATKRQDWRDEAEFSFAYRVGQSRGGFANSPVAGFSGDMVAIRFQRQGFDRFSLSGRDIYLRDGSLSLYANEEEAAEAEKKGGSSTAIWIGLGVAAVVGGGLAAANSAGDTAAAVSDCIVDVIVGQDCDN